MFKRILVPVDLTEKNRDAVDIAAQLAKDGSSKVHLLHVIEVIPGLPEDEERTFYHRIEERVRKHLGQLGERLQNAGATWEGEVRYGSRAREILNRATELASDLIVLSSHRVKPGEKGEGFGTLSYQIAVMAPTKVLLVK